MWIKMGWVLRRTGCDRYEWFYEEEPERKVIFPEVLPERIGHSDEPIPVTIPEKVPVPVEK